MRVEEKILKTVFSLVKGDPSPVHLPVTPTKMSQATDLPLEQVEACCKALESHGYLTSTKGIAEPVYYITKTGVDEALNPTLPFYIYSASNPRPRNRA
ncbi:hypothetical protein [Rufibacter hautae]|uniref:MarR family transcriptional regulator n=1 Tax=Rufibacter hautae TaxID=2595005 RepID=A0A5B6TLB5_9BACT|nr:hypothetical protein [Rufibacter hautae]KAA3436882.1 hypothetical protein FOA19_21140 [Rufibacter hautae]